MKGSLLVNINVRFFTPTESRIENNKNHPLDLQTASIPPDGREKDFPDLIPCFCIQERSCFAQCNMGRLVLWITIDTCGDGAEGLETLFSGRW